MAGNDRIRLKIWHKIYSSGAAVKYFILATSVTSGPETGPGGSGGNGRFYIGGSGKNGERGVDSMTPCGDLFEKFNVNLNVEGISLKIIKFLYRLYHIMTHNLWVMTRGTLANGYQTI